MIEKSRIIPDSPEPTPAGGVAEVSRPGEVSTGTDTLLRPELGNLTALRTRRLPVFRQLLREPLALSCIIVIALWVVAAIIGPFLSPYDAVATDIPNRLTSPNSSYWLGTDQFGRDILLRMLLGARLSLLIAAGTVILAAVIGTAIGAIAGFSRILAGPLMRLVDTLLAFPSLLFAIFIAAVLGQGSISLLVALTSSFSPLFARVAFGEVRALRELEYVQAAKVIGCSYGRLMFKHLIPQMASPLIVQASYVAASAVIFEASLSFIGAGVPPPAPSWGSMISEGKGYMSNAPWMLWPVAIALVSLVLSTSLLGDRMRDLTDPKHRNRAIGGGE